MTRIQMVCRQLGLPEHGDVEDSMLAATFSNWKYYGPVPDTVELHNTSHGLRIVNRELFEAALASWHTLGNYVEAKRRIRDAFLHGDTSLILKNLDLSSLPCLLPHLAMLKHVDIRGNVLEKDEVAAILATKIPHFYHHEQD